MGLSEDMERMVSEMEIAGFEMDTICSNMVRHGQAMHNIEGDNREALLSPGLFDAELSSLGLQQGVRPCDMRRKIDDEDDNLWKPDLREQVEELAARVDKFLKW
ncbi:hypothetical protein COLO4_09833 [Corchorus olitorius]|uniref:Uncharacterized protein n=1 Tax=Corchorus olitorius TaxID=93759 RepID=A0A1R3KAT6_9ROSI|nr:hypothetical protein COLO4_09833 [Corchorus olitorius]